MFLIDLTPNTPSPRPIQHNDDDRECGWYGIPTHYSAHIQLASQGNEGWGNATCACVGGTRVRRPLDCATDCYHSRTAFLCGSLRCSLDKNLIRKFVYFAIWIMPHTDAAPVPCDVVAPRRRSETAREKPTDNIYIYISIYTWIKRHACFSCSSPYWY